MSGEIERSLPPGWAWTTLSEIAEIVGGITKGQRRKGAKSVRPVPYLRVANVQRGFLNLDEMKQIEATDEEIEDLRLVVGDILFTEGGDRDKLGRGWVWNDEIPECIHQNHIFRARLSHPDLSPKLISFYGNSLGQRYFHNQGKQTTNLASINLTKLAALPLMIPPADEQVRIVEKIEELTSRLDAGVLALEHARVKLRRYRAAVMRDAIEGKLTEEWRFKHPAETGESLIHSIISKRRRRWEREQIEKYAASNSEPPRGWQARYREPVGPDTIGLPLPPNGWAVASLDQLTSIITSGSRDWSQYYGEGSGTFLMAQNVRPGKLDLSYRQPVDPPEDDRDRVRSQVEQDDVLITIVGANTGDVCRVPSELPEHYVCQSVALLRPVEPRTAAFIEAYLVSDENGQRQFGRYFYGAGRPHLSFDQIKMTAVFLPPLAEQAQVMVEIDRRLSIVDEVEAQIDANLRRSARLRQGILQRAFEGTLVPQDPDEEPASLLLGRIRAERNGHSYRRPSAARTKQARSTTPRRKSR